MYKYYNASCFDSYKYIDHNSIDMFFCDPPYFISGARPRNINITTGDRNDWDRQWSSKNEFYDWTLKWMLLMYDQLKPTGSAYICSSWQHSGKIMQLLKEAKFKIRNRITWKRDKGRGSKTNWKSMHEDIWFVTKSNTYTFNVKNIMITKKVVAPYRDENGNPKGWSISNNGEPVRMTYPGNLWIDFTVPFWSMKEVRSYAKTKKSPNNRHKKHNTQKPKELVKRCILASTNKGDTVADYFVGSGTTLISAIETGRNCIALDINSVCIEMLEDRLRNEL